MTPNPHRPDVRRDNNALAARFDAQLRATETPEPVRDLDDETRWTLAIVLANVARQAGWSPPPNGG